MSSTLDQLETPEVVVDRDRLVANIERMQELANANQVALRPHIKTHKSLAIARLQLEGGAVGITTAKVDEAIVFIESGEARSVTVAYPIIDRRKLERLARAAAHEQVDLRIMIDSEAGVDAAENCGANLAVFVKVDVGLHRCGVTASSPRLLDLVGRIARSRHLKFAGLLSHAGHAYAAPDRAGIARIAAEERATLLRARDVISKSGVVVPEISVGSTPTVTASDNFEGITEIRPGNYVFHDGTGVRLGFATFADVALSVIVTIVSANERFFIIDAGSKVLSSDLGAHGTSAPGYGVAFQLGEEEHANPLTVIRLSEEHGFLKRGDRNLPIGTKLRVVPNHACPVANLAERLMITSGAQVVDQWPVDARGKVR